ncbi:branched-chain amino acid ABC transporter permease [Sulfitobacter sp. TSTF-M16]|uniref:Branched-chain amino acid ABC transporter permease n=1 Tax=Sulfitobacter aestuariivivens TaxID=2766981 RepID=A0A927D4E6_9RHOB|nr:branched-chain amino acid ABC transporter permease [Sulfitobacter aestuariivivens]MBD3664965.1 branched-chain amino acid ABC transporter permease [Sulfitobacter aestuariivivens]
MDALQLLVSGLANGCVYGLIAMGFVLIYKATEAVNFAQGDMMMLGAFVALGLTNEHYAHLPFVVAVPLTILIMAAVGYLMDAVLLRRTFGQSQIAVVILTIAIGFVFRFVAGVIWGHEPQSLESPLAGRDIRFGGVVLGLDEVFVIVVTIALTVGMYFFFARTKMGVAMQASSQNQMAAYYMGIPVKRVHSLVWALSGAVAAIAGILFASKGSIDPATGFLGIKAFAAAVIGGLGSLPGALLGGIIIGLVEPFSARYLGGDLARLMPYLILVLILVFRPHGILSQVQAKKV